MERPMCQCPDPECRLHRGASCPMPSRVDGWIPPATGHPDLTDEGKIPLCTACAGHLVVKGYRLRARPGDALGR